MRKLNLALCALLVAVVFLCPVLAQQKKAGEDASGVAGTWKLLATMQENTVEYVVELRLEGAKYSGTITTPNGDTVPLTNVSFADSVLKFTVSANEGDYRTESKIEGKKMTGTFTTPNGQKGTFQGTKV